MATQITTPACKSCKHYAEPADGYGLCRRSPPTMLNAPFNGQAASPHERSLYAYFPGVAEGSVCGEYTAKPVLQAG